jgi:signal peptidase I
MMKSRKRTVLVGVAIVLVVAFACYFLFIRMVRVPTGSMKNTILPGDRIAMNRWVGEIHRGDIVMFKFPQDPATRFVSRVIGLPGETIELRGTRVYINGQELAEKRALVKSQAPEDPAPLEASSSEGEGSYTVFYYQDEHPANEIYPASGQYAVREPYQIPADNFFVMGDNRDNAFDSRFWGTVKRDAIQGKPLLLYWSEEPLGGKARWSRIGSRLK